MLKKLMKTAAAATAVFALCSSSAFAAPHGKAELNEYVYNVQSAWTTLYVSSSDGTKWDTIDDGNLQFWAHMKIDTKWPGAIKKVGVVLGQCSGNDCKSFPILWSDNVGKRDYNHQRNFSVSTSLIQDATPGVALAGQNIIETCNQHLTPNGATKRHEFQSSLPTTFVADTVKRDVGKIFVEADSGDYSHPGEIDHAKSGDFTFNVVCKPYVPRTTVNDLQKQEGEFKTTAIDLFLSTYSGATTQPNPATTCKKGRVLVRVKTSKAGPAKFKLWTKVDGNRSSKVVDAWSSNDGNGGFKAEHTEWISVNKTTQVQAMAEDMVNSIGQSTQWKNLTLHCSNKEGGGGFTVDNDTGNPDADIPQAQTLKGDFAFVDHGAPKCERTGKALVTFKSPKADNIHYSLDCKFSSKSGVLTPQPNPAGGYMAATLVPIDVKTTMDETCTLRTVAPYGPKDHVTKGHLFQCVTPTLPPATTDLTPETRPSGDTARNPRVPATLVPNALDKTDASPKTGAGAGAKRLEAARKAAEDKRKREAAAAAERARKIKLKAALERKRAEAARKKAAEAAQAEARRKAAAVAAKFKLLQKRRVPPQRRTTTGNTQQLQMLRLR